MRVGLLEDVLLSAEAYRTGHDLLADFLAGKPVDHRRLSAEEWERACEALDMLDAAETAGAA